MEQSFEKLMTFEEMTDWEVKRTLLQLVKKSRNYFVDKLSWQIKDVKFDKQKYSYATIANNYFYYDLQAKDFYKELRGRDWIKHLSNDSLFEYLMLINKVNKVFSQTSFVSKGKNLDNLCGEIMSKKTSFFNAQIQFDKKPSKIDLNKCSSCPDIDVLKVFLKYYKKYKEKINSSEFEKVKNLDLLDELYEVRNEKEKKHQNKKSKTDEIINFVENYIDARNNQNKSKEVKPFELNDGFCFGEYAELMQENFDMLLRESKKELSNGVQFELDFDKNEKSKDDLNSQNSQKQKKFYFAQNFINLVGNDSLKNRGEKKETFEEIKENIKKEKVDVDSLKKFRDKLEKEATERKQKEREELEKKLEIPFSDKFWERKEKERKESVDKASNYHQGELDLFE